MTFSLTLSPLQTATDALESLIAIGQRYQGLWPSCMSLDGSEVWQSLDQLPPCILGQRDCDRSPGGCNLMHDLPALGAAYKLGNLLDRKDLSLAADQYLETYLEKAIQNETGLFPWGEHAWIDLKTGGMSDGYLFAVYHGKNPDWWDGLPRPVWHDHLRQAPEWFWKKAGQINSRAVQRFADGLDRQWKTEDRMEYNRHGAVSRNMWHGIRPDSTSCDFPRHSGFYIFDLACAYVQEPREKTLTQFWRYADYWWNRRREGHSFPTQTRTSVADENKHLLPNPIQTLSLAASLFESATVLHEADRLASRELRRRALAMAGWTLNATHDPARGRFAASYMPGEAEAAVHLQFFGSIYGHPPVFSFGLLNCAFYNWGAGERFLDTALAIGAHCRRELQAGYVFASDPPIHIPGLDVGVGIDLLCELYAITRNTAWLDTAVALWEAASKAYFTGPLPRLATGCDWYEAQQGSAYLIHAAARLGLLMESGGERDLGADLTAR